MSLEHIVDTDVLVIGGGMAGCFAAIKAKERGVDVTLVDKGYVGKSGSSPWPHSYCVFNPEWGHKLDAWMDQINVGGEYLNNREWTEIVFKESYSRYQDLVSWGVEFLKDENGELIKTKPGPFPFPTSCEALLTEGGEGALKGKKTAMILRKQAIARGVKILDRIMVTDLLKQDGRVVGAIGIPLDNLDLYVFKAKATVISTGAAGFRPYGWPIYNLTGDGMAMAYRAGVEMLGTEFLDTHSTRADYPAYGLYLGRRGNKGETRRLINAESKKLTIYPKGPYTLKSYSLNIEFEAHAGQAPLIWKMDAALAKQLGEDREINIVGGSPGGMSIHTTEGIWPINTKCASSLPGLYAAGDSCGTMLVGAVYSGVGFAYAGASVTGTRAGLGAVEHALQAKKPIIDEEKLKILKASMRAPLKRKGGFTPRWVTQVLQNIMFPYYILFIKHGKRMEAALTLVEFLRDHLIPKMYAKDPHELRLAHETKNMVLNAEMKLRSSLFRTESRGCHYREDYPRRDDPAWLAWVKLKEENGRMKLWKDPIPKEWWPDLSKPYKEKYLVKFPGE